MNESTRKTAFNMISTDKTDLHYISTWHKCFPNAIVDKEVMKHLEQASESMKIVGLEKEQDLTFSEECFIEAKAQIMK